MQRFGSATATPFALQYQLLRLPPLWSCHPPTDQSPTPAEALSDCRLPDCRLPCCRDSSGFVCSGLLVKVLLAELNRTSHNERGVTRGRTAIPQIFAATGWHRGHLLCRRREQAAAAKVRRDERRAAGGRDRSGCRLHRLVHPSPVKASDSAAVRPDASSAGPDRPAEWAGRKSPASLAAIVLQPSLPARSSGPTCTSRRTFRACTGDRYRSCSTWSPASRKSLRRRHPPRAVALRAVV
jgi:hypothetical protein